MPTVPLPNAEDNLRAALDYHDMGMSIVPLFVGEKKPSVKWKPFSIKSSSEDDIRQWFKKHRDVAVCLGDVSDGLCVRDFDDMETYEQWAAVHPNLAAILPTAATGRKGGGRHVYFKADVNDIRERVRIGGEPSLRLDDGGHLKGGGIVVLPPSTHETGRKYKWLIEPNDFPYVSDLVLAGLLPPLPHLGGDTRDGGVPKGGASQLQLLNGSAPVGFMPNTALLNTLPEFNSRESAIDWAVKTSLPDKEGQRHDKIFELIRKLLSIPGIDPKPDSHIGVLHYWHNLALPIIGTKDFRESLQDFLTGWDSVKVPFGATIARAASEVEGETAFEKTQSLLSNLQSFHGDSPFFIGTRLAGSIAGVSHQRAAVLIKRLRDRGKLLLIEEGRFKGRKASVYRYVG